MTAQAGWLENRRRDVGAALETALTLTRNIAPKDVATRLELEDARQLAAELSVSLAVIGGEGHGKSTVINAITGLNLTPTSRVDPGTVAPIVVEHGLSSRPEFRVVTKGDAQGDGSSRTADEFAADLLQRLNPHNVRGIHRGLVRVDHALFRRGLRLIDMPGVAGVSDRVAAETHVFLREEVNAAVAVVGNRGYSPLLRLLETLPSDRLWVEAVVCNSSVDFWNGFGTEPALQDGLSEQRAAVATLLSGSGVSIDPGCVFVLHLPSMWGLKLALGGPVTTRLHRQEVARFAAWLDGYIDGGHARRRIDEAAARGRRAVARLAELNDAIARLARGVLGDDPAAKSVVDREREGTLRRWREFLGGEELSRWRDAAWDVLRDKIDGARSRIGSEIADARLRVDRAGLFELSRSDVSVLDHGLCDTWKRSCEPVLLRHRTLLAEYIDRLKVVGDELLDAVFRGLLPGSRHIDIPASVQSDMMPVLLAGSSPQSLLEVMSPRAIAQRIVNYYDAQLSRVDGSNGSIPSRVFRVSLDYAERACGVAISLCLSHPLGRNADYGDAGRSLRKIAISACERREELDRCLNALSPTDI